MNILILGATGLIGTSIANKLVDDGHEVSGLSRSTASAAGKMPHVRWITADLSDMAASSDWEEVLAGQQVVVNCAGALQDGLSDDLAATQERAMLALYEAARNRGLQLIVQISAETDGAGRESAFLVTKRKADTALVASGVPHVIIRPALVLARNAHGGSALLRALAALPWVIPLAYAENPVATVAVEDVAATVSEAVCGILPVGSDLALASGESLTLRDLVLLHRRWLGLPPARVMVLPSTLARPVAWIADIAGKLGWRSPLRSTAMEIISGGITTRHVQECDIPVSSAAEILAASPSGVQDLWFARLYLLKPFIILTLSLFWLISGLVPFLAFEAARNHFAAFLPGPLASIITVTTSLADIVLGLALLFRPWARRALIGMLCLTLVYLFAATVNEPMLWFDPLGSLVKVLPSLLLTLAALAILEER
ncbi:SDR family oxidoreductase [Brucella intermedia]|uniref:SDR family oxidoreductase n=1 Tax=Brucella intermedia TaxID=94625 RepID=UPI0004695468|nr:SDR family oxidoreductase [Brucella intermedia]